MVWLLWIWSSGTQISHSGTQVPESFKDDNTSQWKSGKNPPPLPKNLWTYGHLNLHGWLCRVPYRKQNHHYYHQIQGQLHITGHSHCDLVVWTTADLQVIRMTKDIALTQNISKLIDLYFSVFIPSLT